MLQKLGWTKELISAFERVRPVESSVSDVATSLKDVVIDGVDGHAADVNVKSQPPVAAPSLRLQLED